MYLGIEIGGTKLQLGLGDGDGKLVGRWRGSVDLSAGGDGIRRQIVAALPELLASAGVDRTAVRGCGIGFGGPIDDRTGSIIKSHQVNGWDGFPLKAWAERELSLPTVIGNDADLAGLAEATHGAGRGFDPVFYVTIGSGVGGGLIQNGKIARGVGLGAAEIGHLRIGGTTLEEHVSGFGIERRTGVSVPEWAKRYRAGDAEAKQTLHEAWSHLADALCHVIALICPARIVIGGGVALVGDVLFEPLREMVAERVFPPFAGCTEIVPAALGEEMAVHGAIRLAAGSFSSPQ